MRKVLSLVLTAVMMLSLIPLSLFSVSAEETDSQGVIYTLSEDGTYYIVSDFDETTNEVVIPAEYNELPVKEIGNRAFFCCDSLTSIDMPDSVTSIGEYAFHGCTGLTDIEMPDSVTSIGEVAFGACSNLTSIVISDSVTTIGIGAFADCESLTSIKIPDSVKSIDMYAFEYCDSLTSIEIPNSVTSIGDSAFHYCESLTDIYCEAESQPDGWDEYWANGCAATVHWGYEMTNSSKPTLGDVDEDGDVDAADYVLVKRAVLKTYTLTDKKKTLADVDKDGDVDATDYVLVKRIVLGTYIVK